MLEIMMIRFLLPRIGPIWASTPSRLTGILIHSGCLKLLWDTL